MRDFDLKQFLGAHSLLAGGSACHSGSGDSSAHADVVLSMQGHQVLRDAGPEIFDQELRSVRPFPPQDFTYRICAVDNTSLPQESGAMPRILSCIENPDGFCLLLDVTPDLSWFRGHFPGQPVLPGIVQLHWATLVASALFGFEDPPQQIKRLKFSKVIVPPRIVELQLALIDPLQVQFNFQGLGQQNSQGRLVFAEPAT
jgi:hypothetical protein